MECLYAIQQLMPLGRLGYALPYSNAADSHKGISLAINHE